MSRAREPDDPGRLFQLSAEFKCNAQFVHLVNQDREVVTDDLRQRLVVQGGERLAPQPVADFPLQHVHPALDLIAVEVEQAMSWSGQNPPD